MGSDLLSHLSANDRALFWEYGQGAKAFVPFQCAHHAFEFHAKANPDLTAVEEFETKITYKELDRQANCLATRLRGSGVNVGSRVCLLVERSPWLVIGVLGVLKAGAAYIPFDGNVVSDSTLKHAIQDSAPTVILTLRKFQHRVADAASTEIVYLDETLCTSYNPNHCTKPRDFTSSTNSVYIIYTSGTTGTPKGVNVTHGNVTNLLCIAPGNLGMKPGIKVSQMLNISFDFAAWEILGSMVNGATLCLRGKTSKEWKAVMRNVDILFSTPSMLAPHNPADYPNLSTVVVAGEACPKATADLWGARVKFYNACGPTEVTIANTMQLHTPGDIVTIGGPTPNNSVYVLDENMRPVPIGEPGVMWGGGAGITKGYLNLPDKTAERYVPDPFADDGSMMFNTGDLGRWHSNGTLVHLGRIDNQVKIKGFRVELDGVATAMETCPGVQAATALLIDGELWGFATPASLKPEDIKEAALKVQPYYAVPTRYLTLDEFPETANGKTDKRILRQMALDAKNQEEKPANKAPAQNAAWVNLPTTVIAQAAGAQPPTIPHRSSERSLVSTVGSTVVGSQVKQVDSSASSALEKEEYIWSGYLEDEVPEKTQGRIVRNLRHQIFNLYRRLFSVVFIINMALFIWILVTKDYDAHRLGGIVVANVFIGVLMRQEMVINTLFIIFTAVPPSWPLCIRRVCARIYTIGGIHSGAGVSAFVWLVAFTAQATKEMINKGKTSVRTVAITYVILAELLGILIFAYPALRKKMHDTFENTHRYLGWTALALVWIQFMFLTIDYLPEGQTLGQTLVKSPHFWLVIIFTISIIWPWFRLRKVDCRPEVLSNHAVRLWFDYGVTPDAGTFVRLSDAPLKEWHGFASISIPGRTGYSVVVSRAGDWTSKHINDPPTKMWVKGVPTYGVLKLVPMFRRMVLVATGSGIGPCAPAILRRQIPMRVLWTAPNVRETFGDNLCNSILEACPDAVIYDTRKHGKPDMVKLVLRLVKEFDAEAVAIISNQPLTEKVVYGCMSRGIPAFGAIWDS
ncbi:nonribosomal peptide synthetase 12 [Coprinopsis cinerea AmutBmut pab1-1]|uniref:Adenylate-forming reductase 06235 n=1 Tax=Coprinopsis cinerea (strain Okayama-7 / 130 / ATCC MYA-4618 / FGSC 9003) TaxID=240176 RepID=N6235_COPC7|nr:RecName: Full=Adenylate-forming reductase 06235; AltName: Full=Alanine/valine/serine reductase; AltName: Full=Nonribosomal peptide synthase 12-like enzyme; Short=NRPS-like [Coprinopsis cinerea okayama7\